jgi:hypothetical protein
MVLIHDALHKHIMQNIATKLWDADHEHMVVT